MTDLELINRILDGDQSGFNQLIWQWEKQIYNFCFRYVGNKDLAKEVTQKTFIRVYKNMKQLRDPTRFSSWIYQIAVNLCKDELKKVSRRDMVSLDMLQENNEENGHRLPDQFREAEGLQPDTKLNQKQIGNIFRKALQEIPEEQRVVIVMKEYQGLKFKEIAEALNQPLSTIKSRMYYGLNSLRKIFEEWQITEEVLNYEL